MSSIRENVEIVREGIADACRSAGRPIESVRLLAVTKYVDVSRIGEAFDAGVTAAGENRVQELREKLTFFEQRGAEVHFIGQLQTNKIKYVCGQAKLVQSVDRKELLDGIARRAAQLDIVQDILLQVNIGDEPQKGGIPLAGLPEFAEEAAACPHLSVRGLMCVPPAVFGEEVRPYFRRMKETFEGLRTAYPALPLDTLSMGMSHDYQIAVQEGATMVRVGSALFGARPQVR